MEQNARQAVEERRPAVRLLVDVAARCATVGTSSDFAVRVVELSTSGLRLRADRRLPIGTSVDVAFELGGRARRTSIKLSLRAHVVRVSREAPPFELALKIVDDNALKDSLRQALLKLNLSAAAAIRRSQPLTRSRP